jgi:hypothetical protein
VIESIIYSSIVFYTTKLLRILLFLKNNSKKTKKPFSKRPKGWIFKAPPIGKVWNF